INVVEARNSRRQAEILAKVPAHALAEQFLPAIAVFGHGRVGVPFLEWNNIGGRLLVSGVHAGGRREKEPPNPVVARGQQQVSVDQYGEHAGSLVGLDESHAAHVGGEIVHPRGTFRDIVAGSTLPKITAAVVDVGEQLKPLVQRFDVHGADASVPTSPQVGDEVTPDESSGASHHNQFIVAKPRLPPFRPRSSPGRLTLCAITLPPWPHRKARSPVGLASSEYRLSPSFWPEMHNTNAGLLRR